MSEELPLRGKRVLITRAKTQSGKLQAKLKALGAEVLAIPAIEIVPPDSYDALDPALREIAAYDWLVLTSANAVEALAARAQQIALPISALSSVSIAAIGNATAEAVRALGLTVRLVPPQAVAESLAGSLAPLAAGKRVLLVRAKVARDVLPQALTSAGARVTIAEAYQTVIPRESIEMLRQALLPEAVPIDAVTFTSASSVYNLAALLEAAQARLPAEVKKISIGPITSQALAEHGWPADAEAAEASVDGLAAALVRSLFRE